jgi:hypothetical protein
MLAGNPPTLVYFDKKNTPPEDLLKGAVDIMSAVATKYSEIDDGEEERA